MIRIVKNVKFDKDYDFRNWSIPILLTYTPQNLKYDTPLQDDSWRNFSTDVIIITLKKRIRAIRDASWNLFEDSLSYCAIHQ